MRDGLLLTLVAAEKEETIMQHRRSQGCAELVAAVLRLTCVYGLAK